MPRGLHKNAQDLTGRRFGRLVVTGFAGRDVQPSGQSPLRWACRCDCGAAMTALAGALRDGRTQSCGCRLKDWIIETKKTHGMRKTPEYRVWGLIKDRCQNVRGKNYKHYGARGITVCAAWSGSFEAFHADMGPRPSANHEIDRIDNDGNYEPGNCRWAVRMVQANNKRNNVNVTAFGKTLTVAQWSRESGIPDKAIYKRLVRGWKPERAVSEELHR